MKSIDKARKDSRVSALLEYVSGKAKLKFRNSSEPGWGSDFNNGTVCISYSGCKHPSASLAHELLHIKAQLNGYKRIRTGISSVDQTESFKLFMTCIDNELQHHKIYDDFISLGFEPHQFYMDSDCEVEDSVRQEICMGYTKLIDAVICFFTVIAPGGTMRTGTIKELKSQFFSVNGGAYKDTLQKIESIVQSWASSTSFDVIPTIRNIMLAMEPSNNLTWFGFDVTERPPNEGFFVDKPFIVRNP